MRLTRSSTVCVEETTAETTATREAMSDAPSDAIRTPLSVTTGSVDGEEVCGAEMLGMGKRKTDQFEQVSPHQSRYGMQDCETDRDETQSPKRVKTDNNDTFMESQHQDHHHSEKGPCLGPAASLPTPVDSLFESSSELQPNNHTPMPPSSYAPSPLGHNDGELEQQNDNEGNEQKQQQRGRAMGSSATPGSTDKLGFEGLPAEVRSMIYDELFVQEYSIRPNSMEDRYMEPPGTARKQRHKLGPVVAFLRCSRLINAEASEVLYGKNSFLIYALDYGDLTLGFLQRIGQRNVHSMRSVELDWQHGIRKSHETSKANELFAMVQDPSNPYRNELARMLHDLARDTILKFGAALELFVGTRRLEHLAIMCPGTDNPGHPDNNCVEYPECPGCHHELPKTMTRIKGVKTLTIGDADWHNELEALGRVMEIDQICVTQLDCIEMSPEIQTSLESQGWSISISWRDPNGEDFRRIATKKLSGSRKTSVDSIG